MPTPYGCPVCGFTANDSEAVRNHLVKATDNPHKEYDMQLFDDSQK
jgi:hypothetical protein